ncbi:MAG TPA: type II toxin-antitoxin system VapC family toxin [Stellaceae bacterium]|nr:type II toxin-antitoxin system VapC family toxin [Stellaceae bacterium]
MAVTASILLDTQFILWLRMTPQVLTAGERSVIDHATTRYLSVVSLMEIAILLGCRRVPRSEDLLDVPAGFDLLPVRPDHCKGLASLPHHHRDPFDRMLIAQAQEEQVSLLTRDRLITLYRDNATILHNPAP